jgi:type IV pilus assembly protein PilM
MALFSSQQSFIGLDFGAGSIKLVELRNEQGRPRLVTYGIYEVPLGQMKDNDWSKRVPEATEALKKLLAQTNTTSNLIISALPTFAVFSSLITVPDVPEKELVNAIRLEAKKVIPRPIEEMILDWKEVSQTSIQPDKVDPKAIDEETGLGTITNSKNTAQKKILITAAPKTLVDAYVKVFKDAKLKLVSLETEALALSRSLVGKDPSVVMVIDVGAKTTNISIIDQGIPVVNRGVNFGGAIVTEALSKKMGIPVHQVEQWKRDVGRDQRPETLSRVMKETLDDVLHEVTYLFQLYRSQLATYGAPHSRIEKVVLAGGSAYIPGLANYLAAELNVPVHLGDPWARIIYPEDLGPMLKEIGPSMAVSIGLAMRYITTK